MTKTLSHFFLLISVACVFAVSVNARTWTSANGAKTFQGELKSYDVASGKVTVTKPNGRHMTFKQDKLSADDVTWLRRTVVVS